jgi:RNA polymerase sigma factor (sigma-70 family)
VPVADRVAWQERLDAELVAGVVQMASGTDRELAFEAIYARHSEAVLARCGQFFSSDLDAAETAAAETLTTAYRDLAAGRPPDEPHKLRGWLCGIARHKCQEELRRRQLGAGLPDELEFDEYENASRERRAEVDRILGIVAATFTEHQRQIFRLSILENLRGQALAKALSVSEKEANDSTYENKTRLWEGFGAYVLAAQGRPYCPELARILNRAAWDGENFTRILRLRIVRHLGTCKICDNCATCKTAQQELLRPLAPALVPILAAAGLRIRVMSAIRSTPASMTAQPGHPPGNPPPPPPGGTTTPALSEPTAGRNATGLSRRPPVKGIIAMVVVLGVFLGGLAFSRWRSGPPANPVPSQRPTAIVLTAPVTSSGRPEPGLKIANGGTAGCQRGSDVAPQAYRCSGLSGTTDILDPCWLDNSDPSQASVLCQPFPWDPRVIRFRVPAGGPGAFVGPAQRINLGHPWGVRLTDSETCLADQGAHDKYNGAVVDYTCGPPDGTHVLLRTLNRKAPQWTYRSAYYDGKTGYRPGPLEKVATAWYALPDKGPAVDARANDCTATALAFAAQAYEQAHNNQEGPIPVITAQACSGGYAETIFNGTIGSNGYTATLAFKATPAGWTEIGLADYIMRGEFGIPDAAWTAINNTLTTAPQNENVVF